MQDKNTDTEELAYWYLRLNGFLTIRNFIIHPDNGSDQRTDIDLIGVRFPHHSELVGSKHPMSDDVIFDDEKKVLFWICEVKQGTCKINESISDEKKCNLERVLRGIGVVAENNINKISKEVYQNNLFENDIFKIQVVLFGSKEKNKFKCILWDDAIGFIYERFNKYKEQKISHFQWGEFGNKLWSFSTSSSDKDDFINKIKLN